MKKKSKVTNPLVKIMDEGRYIPPQSGIFESYKRVANSEVDDLLNEAGRIVSDREKGIRRNRYLGRPSKYSKAIADRICGQIAEGHSLRSIAGVDPHVPSRATVHRWLKENPEFRDQYAQAQQRRAEACFDMALEVACAEPDVQRARLIVDTLKWMAGRLSPKKYGKHTSLGGEIHQSNAVAVILQQIISKPELLAGLANARAGQLADILQPLQLPGHLAAQPNTQSMKPLLAS